MLKPCTARSLVVAALALSACSGTTEPASPPPIASGTATVSVAGDFSVTQHATVKRSDLWARASHRTVMSGPTGIEQPVGESFLELIWHRTGVVGPAPLELRLNLQGDVAKFAVPHTFPADSVDASLEVLQVDSGNVAPGDAMYHRVTGTVTIMQVTDSAMIGTFTLVFGPSDGMKPLGAHLTVTGTFNAPWCQVDGVQPPCTPQSYNW